MNKAQLIDDASGGPVFERRTAKEKYLVRFWSSPDQYERFVAEVEKHDLVIQDVFNQMMNWFIQTSQSGVIKTRDNNQYGGQIMTAD